MPYNHTTPSCRLWATFHLEGILCFVSVASNEFALGIGTGWIAPVLHTLQPSTEQSSWIVSLEHFGRTFGVALASVLIDGIGRKPVLTASALLLFGVWFGVLFSKSVLTICATRLLFGVAGGLNDGSNSVYLGEVSSPAVRSIFGSVSMTMYFLGILVEFLIATYLSYSTVALVNLAIVSLTLIPLIWLTEPAQFLLMKGKHIQAQQNLMWLCGVTDPKLVHEQFQQMQENVHQECLKRTSLKKKLTSPANYKSILIVFIIYALTGASGYYPVMSYATLTFSSNDTVSSKGFTILFGASQLLISMFTSFVNKRFNRRAVILSSFSMAAFAHLCTSILYYVQDQLHYRIPHFSWLVFFTITGYSTIFAFVYPTVFLIRAELFPLSIKAAGGSVSIMGFSATSFLMTKIFMYIYTAYGIHGNFLLFFVVNVVTVIFVYFTLPETKNKSLIEIQEILEKRNV